jgi:hypothetical protein
VLSESLLCIYASIIHYTCLHNRPISCCAPAPVKPVCHVSETRARPDFPTGYEYTVSCAYLFPARSSLLVRGFRALDVDFGGDTGVAQLVGSCRCLSAYTCAVPSIFRRSFRYHNIYYLLCSFQLTPPKPLSPAYTSRTNTALRTTATKLAFFPPAPYLQHRDSC